MNQRTFIIALASLMFGAAGFVSWVTLSSKKGSSALQTTKPASEKKHVPEKSARKTVESNRYQGLTSNSVRWQVRVDQLRRMDATTLNQTEIDFLYSQLNNQPSGRKEGWWVVVNEVMEQIVKQEIDPNRITSEFTSLIENKQLDPVVRDYAIQHLGLYLKSHTNEPKDLEKSLTSIMSAIKDPDNQHHSIPGTAFMGLIEVAQNPNHQQKVKETFGELESYLMPLIKGESSSNLANRTSAINAVGLIKAEQYLPVLRGLITAAQVNDSTKLSSIASIGDFYAVSPSDANGTDLADSMENDQAILQTIADSNTKFKYAAIAALHKFQN